MPEGSFLDLCGYPPMETPLVESRKVRADKESTRLCKGLVIGKFTMQKTNQSLTRSLQLRLSLLLRHKATLHLSQLESKANLRIISVMGSMSAFKSIGLLVHIRLLPFCKYVFAELLIWDITRTDISRRKKLSPLNESFSFASSWKMSLSI